MLFLPSRLLSFRKSTWNLRVEPSRYLRTIMRLSEVFKTFLIIRMFYRCVRVRPQCPRNYFLGLPVKPDGIFKLTFSTQGAYTVGY